MNAVLDALAGVPRWAWSLTGAGLGAIVGSFVATLVVRWPAGVALGGRSRCDACGGPVGASALVPLASFVLLGGRCRACRARIDPRHPLVEAAAAAIGAIAFWVAPGASGVAGALFGWLLLALAVLDLEHLWLPDRLTAALAAAGLAGGAFGLSPRLADRLAGGIAGYAALALIAAGYARMRGRVGLGQGDPKLLGAVGLWLGWQALPLVLLGASLGGLAGVGVGALCGRPFVATDKVPLGTLIAAAAWALWWLDASGALRATFATAA